MSEEIELRLLREIEELKQQLKELKGLNEDGLPTYSFSKIRDKELKELFDIKKSLNPKVFDNWFNNNLEVSKEIESFFITLIEENIDFIDSYNEEDLKVHFIIPLLNTVKFKSIEYNIRDFYETKLVYKTDDFVFSGTTDFLISKGLFETEKPYFFIQEFKRDEEYGNPRPQLLSELISAVELNDWTTIKGAYIVGSIWRFVVLEKLGEKKYQYYVSQNFDSTKIEDLKDIYKNLVFVKNEIIEMIKKEENK
jgi:hypothetical protein